MRLIGRAGTLQELKALVKNRLSPVKKKTVDILRKHLRKDDLTIINRFSVVSLFQASKEVESYK